jgi:hypothetical protein
MTHAHEDTHSKRDFAMIAMSRAILAGTAIVLALAATPASAGLWENGVNANGLSANGLSANGLSANGANLNTVNSNIVGSGQTVPGGNPVRVIGIELPR